jgi:hypothetical protein
VPELLSGRQVQVVHVATKVALQLAFQDSRIQFWHIFQKELMHPKFRHTRLLFPDDSCVIKEKAVLGDVVRPGALPQLQQSMKRLGQLEVVIPKVPQPVVCG